MSSSANSVSIQRVCTRNGEPSVGTNASASSTALWNGTTVGMPSTTSSRSARRARSTAWVRVAPVTMSLAIMESNAPETVSPATTPVSTRTPGPDGQVIVFRRPGAGRKPAAGSSPLMRNSRECPRIAGES